MILSRFCWLFIPNSFRLVIFNVDKGKRNQPNANSTVAPNNFNNSNAYFNDTDTFFNDSFQPSAQSTYYSASIQQQQQSIQF